MRTLTPKNAEHLMNLLIAKSTEKPCPEPGLYPVCWAGSRGEYTQVGGYLAHRLSYAYFRGAFPTHLVIDHLCRNKPCWNPWHLDPVTTEVNVSRGSRDLWDSMEEWNRSGHQLAFAAAYPGVPYDDTAPLPFDARAMRLAHHGSRS